MSIWEKMNMTKKSGFKLVSVLDDLQSLTLIKAGIYFLYKLFLSK